MRLILAFLFIVLSTLAIAQEKHDLNDPNHWYDWYCCHQQDCAPIIDWHEVEGGWIITNKQNLMAFLPKDYMTNSQITVKPSKDGEYHACINPDMRKASDKKGRVICVYVPLNM